MLRSKCLFAFLISFLGMNSGFAQNGVGTLTRVSGPVQILTQPGKTSAGTSPRVLFEGTYYTYKDAEVGSRLESGNLIRTLDKGKAQVIYDNGDQFVLGPSSSYRVFCENAAVAGPTQIDFRYGNVRSVISKRPKGARLNVKTKSAVMGVRGTDFVVTDQAATPNAPTATTRLQVLRGEVEMKPIHSHEAPVIVKKGQEGLVPEKISKETKKVEVAKLTQETIADIHQTSAIPASEALKAETAQEVKTLETQAVAATLNDIKQTDPALHKKLAAQSVTSPLEVNAEVLGDLFDSAPKDKNSTRTVNKPSKDELEKHVDELYKRSLKN